MDILNLEDPEFTMTPWEKLIAGMTFGLYVSGTYSVKVEIADGGGRSGSLELRGWQMCLPIKMVTGAIL